MAVSLLYCLLCGEIRSRCCRYRWYACLLSLSLLFCIGTATAQEESSPIVPPPSPQSSFEHLWARQAYLNISIPGYREVRETDLFRIRYFNPNGPDLIVAENRDVTTRQSGYALLSAGGALNRIFPLRQYRGITLHGELSGSFIVQKIILPSWADNTIYAPDHYPVRYYNLPTFAIAGLKGGIWFYEWFSLGLGYTYTSYALKTHDDRMEQKDMRLNRHGLSFHTACWVPLEYVKLDRWHARISVEGQDMLAERSGLFLTSMELSLFHLSKQRTGRTTGIFLRYLSVPGIKGPEQYPDYSLHHDTQVLLGVGYGIGGLNLNRGR